jgi:glucose-6-phosphate dehydrogenase assembly protein OpcA
VTVPAHVDEWTGEDVTVAEIDRELARLRSESASHDGVPDLRTSVMTHLVWAPAEWVEAATRTLAGLAEQHPSRTILLTPVPDADDGLDADLSLRCFPLGGTGRHVCGEVVHLRLRGRRADAPASVVLPLLVADLPVFCRWRGEPPFGTPLFDQLVAIVDRLVVDAREWDDPDRALPELARCFDRAGVSDIAWARTLPWRLAIAELWPEVAEVRELRVASPRAEALLLGGWLRSRLGRDVELVHEDAEELEGVAVDGTEVTPRPAPAASASDLLSEELERFGRDRVYEDAVRAARSDGS